MRFFIQWAIFSVIGTLGFLALLRLDKHFHFHPPFAFAVALMPAYFLLGMVFIDMGPGTASNVIGAVAFVWDAMYYGFVLLIAWRALIRLARRRSFGSTSRDKL